jgi:two-component sensor histidine kinase
MSLLYDKLYRSTDFKELSIKEYLSILVDEVIANFPNCDDVTVIKNMDDFMLDAERLQALGIMVNELLTNTMKYAFKPKVPGLITVTVEKAGQKVIIKVKDNGKGIPEQVNLRKSKGFGLQLVQKLAEQLGGTLEIIRGNGSEVVLEFTL